MSLKLAILATIAALPFEVVAVPEFGEGQELRVGVMSVAERDLFDNTYRAMPEATRAENFRSLLVICTVKDADGQPVFGVDDLAEVKKLNSLAIIRLAEVALRINKMLKQDVESAEKNS